MSWRIENCRVAAAALWVLSYVPIGAAADPWADIRVRPADIVGTLSCSGTSCHGSQQSRLTLSTVTQQEFVHWTGRAPRFLDGRRHYDPRAEIEQASGDPHAQAAWRMQQPRFLEVLRRASVRADGSVDSGMAARCARCHDPMAMAATGVSTENVENRVLRAEYPVHNAHERGIGCESCHGAARRWLAAHYQRDVDRQQLSELGMIDTKNLLVRARVCAACHVGSRENDMNHDMIAAGHPPLRFELASYEALIKHKHWDDRPQRMANADYEMQLWAAGRIASADAALELLEARAGGEETGDSGQRTCDGERKPWPEFSELNCFACHQTLQPAAVGDSRLIVPHTNGQLGWQSWNVALVERVVGASEIDGNLPPPKLELDALLTELRRLFQSSLSPEPQQVARVAATARAALRAQVRISDEGTFLAQGGAPLAAKTMLRSVWSRPGDDWDEMCQQVAALAAARKALLDRGVVPNDAWRQQMAGVAAALRLSPDIGRPSGQSLQQQLAELASSLRLLEEQSRPTTAPEALP